MLLLLPGMATIARERSGLSQSRTRAFGPTSTPCDVMTSLKRRGMQQWLLQQWLEQFHSSHVPPTVDVFPSLSNLASDETA